MISAIDKRTRTYLLDLHFHGVLPVKHEATTRCVSSPIIIHAPQFLCMAGRSINYFNNIISSFVRSVSSYIRMASSVTYGWRFILQCNQFIWFLDGAVRSVQFNSLFMIILIIIIITVRHRARVVLHFSDDEPKIGNSDHYASPVHMENAHAH